MARPTIDRLFDHQVRIWRPTSSTANRIGAEVRSYSLIATVGAAVNRNVSPQADQGVGMVDTGRRRLYLRPDANVLARDVLELIEGPDSPGTWEVDQNPTRPRGHHTQVDTVHWNGVLPAPVQGGLNPVTTMAGVANQITLVEGAGDLAPITTLSAVGSAINDAELNPAATEEFAEFATLVSPDSTHGLSEQWEQGATLTSPDSTHGLSENWTQTATLRPIP